MTFEITLFEKHTGVLSKRISLGPDGSIDSDGSECTMPTGKAWRNEPKGLREFAALISSLKSHRALALGALRKDLPDEVEIVTLKNVNGNSPANVIARTSSNIVFEPCAPSLALIDVDLKTMPQSVADRVEEMGGVIDALLTVMPELANVGSVIRASTSSELSNGETGEAYPGTGGLHIFIVVANGSDIERFIATLSERLWLAGCGWYVISKSGALLMRSLVDTAVGASERLIFEAPPIVLPPLLQGAREPSIVEGGTLDTTMACPPLNAAEKARLKKLRDQERKRLAPEAAKVRSAFIAEQAEKLVARGLSQATARRIVELQAQGVLTPEVLLPFDDAGSANVTVADVLADPESYIGLTMADPTEPEAGRNKAKLLARDDGSLIVHSFLHGGITYQLRDEAIEGKEVERAIAEINRKHAVVLAGNKAAVLMEQIEADGRHTIKLLPRSTFATWMANVTVRVGREEISLSGVWIASKKRRQYEGIVFDPSDKAPANQYNLWRGFSVEPRPGDCSKFLMHVRENVCCGNKGLYTWVEAWFADIIQHPADRKGTALGLRGRQGVGKTIVGKIVGSLFADHYVRVDDPRYVVGRFNGHMVQALLLQADEAFWAGDKAAEGKLKGLVTDDHQLVEYKGLEAITIKNHVRLLITSNQDWVVPAGAYERRFAVLDVGQKHIQDHAYFAAIEKEMENGGREALLHHFLTLDISGVDLRTIPNTTALREQQIASLSPEAGWWLDLLQRGQLPGNGCVTNPEPAMSPVKAVVDAYVQHAQRRGIARRSTETQIGMFLTKMVGGNLRRSKRTYRYAEPPNKDEKIERGIVYAFPPLGDCRKRFEAEMNQQFDWTGPETWQAEQNLNAVRNADTGIFNRDD